MILYSYYEYTTNTQFEFKLLLIVHVVLNYLTKFIIN